jgi:hypothetical protein
LAGAGAGLAGSAGSGITFCAGVTLSTFLVVLDAFLTEVSVGSFFFGMNHSSESFDEFQNAVLPAVGTATF